MNRTPKTIAKVYGVSPRQARRWIANGLPVEDPTAMAIHLAGQRNPGRTLDRLASAERLERLLDVLEKPEIS